MNANFNYRELKISGTKIVYKGIVVATINDFDMSAARFEFEDFLKKVEKGVFKDESE